MATTTPLPAATPSALTAGLSNLTGTDWLILLGLGIALFSIGQGSRGR
jgi:hypothetical protein